MPEGGAPAAPAAPINYTDAQINCSLCELTGAEPARAPLAFLPVPRMLPTRFYYDLKPFLPLAARIWLRRRHARRMWRRHAQGWPVSEAAGQAPPGWPGWPEGRQFGVVLTHDVEGAGGVSRCGWLMDLEESLGFRSSFNFVPEGSYRVEESLRREAAARGFEVGVHDLHHDGKLFRSKAGFERHAGRINHYLKEWGAQGFRAGFMLRNLEWLHQLDIRYDATTFDTDPFEPQPEGTRTAFPFYVKGPEGRPGYAELPYTLVQDSTLFVYLQQRDIELWKRKVDWVAAAGGLVMVIVHPDYLRAGGGECRAWEYPAARYEELLRYLRERYEGRYWQALPREAAAFVAEHQERLARTVVRNRPYRRVCMVTHSFYESDNRVMRYAEALAGRGDEVDVLALQRPERALPRAEQIQGVRVTRMQERNRKDRSSRLAHLGSVLRFLGRSAAALWGRHRQEGYDVAHIHNMPDFMVYAAAYPRWRGARVVLDIHDLLPEFYAAKFGGAPGRRLDGLLKWIERRSARFADRVIISNHLWQETYARRSRPEGGCSVFINHVDLAVFKPGPPRPPGGPQVVLFPGGLYWHQGLDIAIQAFHRIRDAVPLAQFHIYGDGDQKDALKALALRLGLEERVRFFEPLPLRQIARVMAQADLGVVPKRADSFGNEAYSTKIMEFMAVGTPVMVSRTKVDQYYFDESVVCFFESGNDEELARRMLGLLQSPQERAALSARALVYAQTNSWDARKQEYLELVDGLAAQASRSGRRLF